VISILLEGNWLPLPNVLVNHVGKYRYRLCSPDDNAFIYLVVDVVLVSRTKVVSIHSPVWLENATDMQLGIQLHVPTSLLAFVPEGCSRRPADRADDQAPAFSESCSSMSGSSGHESTRPGRGSGHVLRPLAAGCGRYLPLAAMLDGVLSLTPSGVTLTPNP
jgi:hypothetical protein